MRLSEAIKLGAMLKPQGFHAYAEEDFFGTVHTCALGAAADALGVNVEDEDAIDGALKAYWPTEQPDFVCPVCGAPDLGGITITHLNDFHKWTREQIADWLATVEPEAVAAVDPIGDSSKERPRAT